MKQLKFNEKKILKALLDKTKTITLRLVNQTKPCKYKVGDIVEAVWRNRNSAYRLDYPEVEEEMPMIHSSSCFKNPIGKVKITKIEKVEISLYEEFYKKHAIIRGRYEGNEKDLSKTEGFENPEEMFKYLEEYVGDLNIAKAFWLIEFEWEEKSI